MESVLLRVFLSTPATLVTALGRSRELHFEPRRTSQSCDIEIDREADVMITELFDHVAVEQGYAGDVM